MHSKLIAKKKLDNKQTKVREEKKNVSLLFFFVIVVKDR